MEPRWHKAWLIDYGDRRCVGGLDRFDLWVVPQDAEVHRELRAVWGPTAKSWDNLLIDTGGTGLTPYYKEKEGPTKDETTLIHRYLALFVPELGLVLKGEDNGTSP
jgi:hypothetical protein